MSLYREEQETKTPITPITQKTADAPSIGTVATHARPSFPVEGFSRNQTYCCGTAAAKLCSEASLGGALALPCRDSRGDVDDAS
jgi:hypothetical protein